MHDMWRSFVADATTTVIEKGPRTRTRNKKTRDSVTAGAFAHFFSFVFIQRQRRRSACLSRGGKR